MPGIGKPYETDPNAYAGIGRKIIEAVRGAVTAPGGEAGILTEAGRTLDYPLSERGRGIVTTTPTPPVVSPANPVIAPTINPSAIPTKETPHPWDKYKNIYEHLADMPDAEFMSYVDRHEGATGLGYVAPSGYKPGKGDKGKIQRIIQNPEDRPEGGHPGIGLKQYEALQKEKELAFVMPN